MLYQARTLASALIAALVTLFAAHGSAQVATVCTRVGVDNQAAVDLKLAIASNFYGSAQVLAQDYIAASGGAVDSIVVCHNSTGTLNNEIRGTNTSTVNQAYTGGVTSPIYDYVFAANTTMPTGLVTFLGIPGNQPFIYARGIPVLFTRKNQNPLVQGVGDLVTGLGTGASYSFFGSGASIVGPFELNANAGPVGIATPSAAPYGNAAKTVTTDMGYLWSGDIPPADSVFRQTTYANVDLAYAAVAAGTAESAVVAKAQICEEIQSDPNLVYVEFQSYLLDQAAIALRDPASNTNVAAFTSYLNGRFATDWNNFLLDECYATIAATAVPIGDYTAPFTAVLLLVMGYALSRKAQDSMNLA